MSRNAESDLQLVENSNQSIPSTTVSTVEPTSTDHAELHRRLHELHHQQALTANQSIRSAQSQNQSITADQSISSAIDTINEDGNHPTTNGGRRRTQTVRNMKTKKKSKNRHNQSRNSCEFEFTKSKIVRNTLTNTKRGIPVTTTGDTVSSSGYSAAEMRNTIPEIRNTVPEIRNTVPEIRNTVPQIRNTVPQTRSTVPEIRNAVPEIRNTVPATEVTVSLPEHNETRTTKTTVGKQDTVTRTERSIDWTNGLIGVHLEEIPEVRSEMREMIIQEEGAERGLIVQRYASSIETPEEEDDDTDEPNRSIIDNLRESLGNLNIYSLQCVMVIIAAVLILPLVSTQQLQIQACCGNQAFCQTFTRAEDLFGVACCGQLPYNAYNQICCSGNVRDRRTTDGRYAEMCCGTEILAYDQTCCNGVVHNVANGDCCGTAVYAKTDQSLKCCNNTLTRSASTTDICCGSSTFDGGRSQMCCGNKVFIKTDFDSCCESSVGAFQEFNSATQFCCDRPQPRNGDMACCYLRKDTGLIPAPYNKKNQCCAYPFDIIKASNNGNCTF